MLLRKLNTLLFLILNVSVTMGLRFFQSRKKKKNCLVRDEWNFHNVTCTSKYQKCCATGCCDSAVNNLTSTYVKVFIVCSVITVIFAIIYTEGWCKKKWGILRNSCKKVDATGLKNSENCQELRMVCDNEENV